MFGAEEDFRCSVVLGHNFLGHGLAGVIFLHPRQTEITNFQNTVGVDQQVSWLDVPMDDFWSVKVLDSSEYLVEEHLDVVRREVLGGDDDFVQIALH